MASNFDYSQFINTAEKNNSVGTIESMLSGVASGLIAIPKGFFSLGASLMDLGVNSGKAAAVEKKPFGIAIRPDATPDSIDSIVPTLLFFSAVFINWE